MMKGDPAAFSKVFKHFYNPLLRYGMVILQDRRVVEDQIQDLFVWILEHPESVKKVHHFEMYLFQSLKRNLRQYMRRKDRSKKNLERWAQDDSSRRYITSFEQQKTSEENNTDLRRWVRQKLETLPPRQKEIIFLRYYQGMAYEEIAMIMSTSNQVIRNYMSRALIRIRKMRDLEKFFPGLISLFIF